MLRGIQKNMIFVQTPKSKCFESAYFVIRAGRGDRGAVQGEMIREANRIIFDSELSSGKKSPAAKRVARQKLKMFFGGALVGSGAVALLWLVTLFSW